MCTFTTYFGFLKCNEQSQGTQFLHVLYDIQDEFFVQNVLVSIPSKILFIVKSEALGFLVCQDHNTVSICACSS